MELINLNNLPEELKENVYALSDNFYALDKYGQYDKEHNKLLIEFIKGDRNSVKCKAGITDGQLVELLLHRAKENGESTQVIWCLEIVLEMYNIKTIKEEQTRNLKN